MSKSSILTSLKNFDFSEDGDIHQVILWLSSKKKIVLWSLIGLLILLLVSYRITALRTLDAESDFSQAQASFTQLQQAGQMDSKDENKTASADLEKLVAIMQRYPELEAKYEGPLSQMLLISGQVPQASLFADDVFKRTQSDQLDLYQDYSKTSLLIGEQLYSQALEKAQQLKQRMDQNNAESTNPILYVMNLMRLAALYQALDQTAEELQIWELFQGQPHLQETMIATNHAFKAGRISLNQFIENRKQVLKQREYNKHS